ncbi:hypothetical protein D3C78_1067210 [compost metagenome]
MGAGGGELHHVLGLAHVIQTDGLDQHAAGGTVEDGVQQHRAQRAFAQLVKELAETEAQEGFVLQRLYGPLAHRLDEGLHRFAGEGQFEQARRLLGGRDGEPPGLQRHRHHKVLDLRKGVHGGFLAKGW